MSTISHDAAAGIVSGILAVFLVVYAFQPNRPYPSWILEPAEKPWMFVLILIVIGLLFKWDYLVATLALLFMLAVVLDIIVFTRQITDTMEISETLFTPAISLLKSSELFKNESEILQREDQVSKQWTINKEPDPYHLRRNAMVGENDQGTEAGEPLFDAPVQSVPYYPIFDSA